MPVTPTPEDFLGKTVRRFKPPWTAERIPGGYVVKDATGQSLAYVYARETPPLGCSRWTRLVA